MHQQFITVASQSGRYHQRVAVSNETNMADSDTVNEIVQPSAIVDL
jgi:hypothetical protein